MLAAVLLTVSFSLPPRLPPKAPAGYQWSEVPSYGFASTSLPDGPGATSSTTPVAPPAVPDAAPASTGKVTPTAKVESKPKAAPRKPSPQGIFAPAVLATKSVMGTKELNALRAKVIAEHTKVIQSFVDTSESKFGQIVLKRMFEAADKDGNGTLDREEIKAALDALGFGGVIKDAQLKKIMDRADLDGNEVIDFEEFVQETPKTLRVSLVKLAKQNGHDLGFLA